MVIESAGNAAAAKQAFLNRSGVDALIGDQDRRETLGYVRLRNRFVAECGGLLKDGIERLRHRADLGDGCIGGTSAGAVATGATDSRGLLTAEDALAGCNRTCLRRAAGHARQRTTGLGALDAPLLQNRVIASHLNIDIVFERERDGILRP